MRWESSKTVTEISLVCTKDKNKATVAEARKMVGTGASETGAISHRALQTPYLLSLNFILVGKKESHWIMLSRDLTESDLCF